MSAETYFLQPSSSSSNSNPNFANASGNATFFGFSHAPSGSLNKADANSIVKGGEAFSSVIFDAVASKDPALSDLAADIATVGLGGTYEIDADVKLKIVSSYDISAKENFSFDFSADVAVDAKEIENPKREYNFAKSRAAFLVLDITRDARKPKIIDSFNLSARLITSKKKGTLKLNSSKHVDIIGSGQDKDINGNDGVDFVEGDAFGRYSRTFRKATKLTVVKVDFNKVDLLGDDLLGNLGNDVRYGTLWDDRLKGTRRDDKLYGSLGNDLLDGKNGNDILEGGIGNDTLQGGSGADKLHGGLENDRLLGGRHDDILVGGQGADKLKGGRGSDEMIGGEGADYFIFPKNSSFHKGDHDIIRDFKVGTDKVLAKHWNINDVEQWFEMSVSQGRLSDTSDGAILSESKGGTLLFENVSVSSLSASDFIFS